MVETYPYVFEFTVSGGCVIFDFGEGKVILKAGEEEKEFPAPTNLHNFCVVMGGILYQKNVTRKQVFFVGPPGSRKVIELRGILYKKEKEEKEGDQNGSRQRPRAIITFIDESEGFKRSFMFNIFNIYALWELFRMQDKVVSVDDLVFERREGNLFVQGIPVPFQKAKAIFHALDEYLRNGKLPAINQDWEYGRIMLWTEKGRMDLFKKNGGNLIPYGVVRMNPDNALRIMSVL